MFNRSLLKNQAHKNQRKMRTIKFLSIALILIVGMILTFQGCQKDFENEVIQNNLNNINLKKNNIII